MSRIGETDLKDLIFNYCENTNGLTHICRSNITAKCYGNDTWSLGAYNGLGRCYIQISDLLSFTLSGFTSCCGVLQVSTIHYQVPITPKDIQRLLLRISDEIQVGIMIYMIADYQAGLAKTIRAAGFKKVGNWIYNPNSGNDIVIYTQNVNQDQR